MSYCEIQIPADVDTDGKIFQQAIDAILRIQSAQIKDFRATIDEQRKTVVLENSGSLQRFTKLFDSYVNSTKKVNFQIETYTFYLSSVKRN